MADLYLKDLTTEHPGGWEDIIAYVNAHFDRYKANYKAIEATVEKDLSFKVQKAEVIRIVHTTATNQVLSRLEEIHHPIGGICASMGWAILKALGLPIPGHKDWLKPCSKWSADEKS
jgi:hypothetical protein